MTSLDIGPGNCLIDKWIRTYSKKKYDIVMKSLVCAFNKYHIYRHIHLFHNDLQYNILSLDGVIGIQELKLFQDGNDEYATGRKLYYYQGDGDIVSDGNIDYGFQYNFENALENGIYRPSVTPAVFELRNPNNDIYGKVI